MTIMAPLLTGSVVGTSTAVGAKMATIGAGIKAALPVASTVLSGLGAIGQYRAAQGQAAQVKAVAASQQKQAEYVANQELAASQREALAARRKGELMMSRAMAVASASGAGTTGIEGILAGIAKESEEDAQYALYSGQDRAATTRFRGQVGVAEARNESRVMRNNARSTLIGSLAGTGMGLYQRYF